MRIVPQSYSIETPIGPEMLTQIERVGRTCYKSEDKITADSAAKFVAMLINRGHHAMLEHAWMSVRFVCDRGVSHEIVRHRIAAYGQESTRYCNYSKEKFGEEITVIDPGLHMPRGQGLLWADACAAAENSYFALIKEGAKPQMARSVLPNSLKTEIVMTTNTREWRHFFTLRAASPAHPQMRELACPLLAEVRRKVPVLFDDVGDPDCGETK